MWLVITITATVCFAFARLLQKAILNNKSHDPIAYSIFFQFLVALCFLPISLVEGFIFPTLSQVSLGLTFCVVIYSLANISAFIALKKVPISEFTILLATIPIWTTITSVAILNESTHPIKLLGILLTTVGIIFVFYSGRKFIMNKYHYLTLLAAISFGVAATNDAYLLQYFTPSMYGFVSFLLPSIVLAIIYYKRLSEISTFIKGGLIKFLAPSAFYALYALGINMAYKTGGEISRIITIVQSNIIIVILFGVLFFHEKENLRNKLIGGWIVFLGIILVQMK